MQSLTRWVNRNVLVLFKPKSLLRTRKPFLATDQPFTKIDLILLPKKYLQILRVKPLIIEEVVCNGGIHLILEFYQRLVFLSEVLYAYDVSEIAE